jgi:hypothetical protein
LIPQLPLLSNDPSSCSYFSFSAPSTIQNGHPN